MAAPPPRQPQRLDHKVKFGAPARTHQQVLDYMTDENVNLEIPGGLGPLSFSDSTQVINADLLQIISKGINNIVDNLKRRLGKDFNESNTNAGIIRERLDQLKRDINTDINGIDGIMPDVYSISLNNQANNYSPIIGVNYLPLEYNSQNDISLIDANYNFENLDTAHEDIMNRENELYNAQDETEYNQREVENRLRNCQNLEFLYLKKHDEIMKIFQFTLNLFDKYKYAINVMLFLLKHLVYKDPNPPPPPNGVNRIKMPRRIIKNIKKLLEDQKKVQGVINKMKAVIVDDAAVDTHEQKLQKATSPKPDGEDVPVPDIVAPVDETATIIPKIPLILEPPAQQPPAQQPPARRPAPPPPGPSPQSQT